MQFNSYIFILLFLPVVIAGYYMLNRTNITAGKLLIIMASIFFYAYANWRIMFFLGLNIMLNYLFAHVIRRSKKYDKVLLAVSVVGNVALLLYFKYTNFFLENISNLFRLKYNIRNIILPIGISFLTFQQIAYLVSVYKSEIEKVCLIDYMAYILYFPKLLMGPIVEPAGLISQLNNSELKRVHWDNMSYGIKLFSFGLFKKMVLADVFSGGVSWGYTNFDVATSMDWLLIMLFYTFEIYFDFSGYSDMAVGVSLMLNITLPINFDSPYKAVSIRDFWKRWHMSLTGFLTKYIYIPLGGNKKGRMRTYINTIVVFLISGLWHGANWTFILWGILHGVLSVLDRIFDKKWKKLMEAVRWKISFLLINILWLLFRSDSIIQWRNILIKIFSFQNTTVSEGLIQAFRLPESTFITNLLHLGTLNTNVRGFWLLLFTLGAFLLCLIPENNYRKLAQNSYFTMILAAVTFVWSFMCLSSESVFVYFNF